MLQPQQIFAVTSFIKNSKHKRKKEMDFLRKLILQPCPQLTEHIKWNAPSFMQNGVDCITFNLLQKDSIALVFHRGAKPLDTTNFVFSKDQGLFEWKAKDRAIIKLADQEDVELKKEKLIAVIKAWVGAVSLL